jgi:hypothetical protein
MRIIGNLDGTGSHYKVVEGKKIKLTAAQKKIFMAASADRDKAKIANAYRQDRINAYNKAFGELSNQVDILQKQFKSMAVKGEIVLTEETQAWIDKIAAIKAAHPKPTE